MIQVMKIILDMQKSRGSENDTTALGARQPQSAQKVGPKAVTGANCRKGVVIRYEDTTDGQEEQHSGEEDDDEQDKDPTHDLPPKGKSTSHQAETKINKGTPNDFSSQEKAKLELIKERLRAIKGTNFPGVKNAFEMCLGGNNKPYNRNNTQITGSWFNSNVTCEYHFGVIGHSIEHCRALKHKVQSLINAKQLHFKPIVPDVDRNPLPNHGNQGVNVVDEARGSAFVWEADEIRTPIRVIFQEMCKRGMVERLVEDEDSASCQLHGEVGHTLEECPEFKLLLKKMIDMRLITIERGPSYQTLHPQITRWVPIISRMEPVLRPAAEERPRPFPYKTHKAIEVTNVVGESRITRSGRVYVPSDVEKALAKDKGKRKVYILVEDELEANLNDLLHKHGDKGEVSNEEAYEFLKFIKQSEYRVVDQLNRTPARISILSLLMSYEPHRKVHMEILNHAHVSHDITTDKLGGIINNIVADNYISFSDQEIPSQGIGHTSPLHISIMYQNCLNGKVLIDNGSSLNVMSKRTLSRLLVDASYMRPSSMVVKAFDGSNRDVMGEMELPIKIGPCTFQIIHASGAVPSTLHERVKFIVDGKLVTVMGEEDMLVSRSLDTPYIEAAEEVIRTSFQALEIANASFVGGGTHTLRPQPSEALLMMAKVMLQKGYQPGKGLGKFGQGRESLVMLLPTKDWYGLEYRPTREDREGNVEEKRKGRMARLGQWEYEVGGMVIPYISRNFISAGLEPRMIVVVGNDDSEDGEDYVVQCPPDTTLSNWIEKDASPQVVLETISNINPRNNNHVISHTYNHDHPNNQLDEGDSDEEWEASPELLRMIEQESREIKPREEPTELVNLGTEDDEKEVEVGTLMKEEERKKIIQLLHEFKDVFAWSYVDMLGLDKNIVEQKLPLNPDSWVANVVAVPKKGGKLRICVDY
ncbi:PREDICTED: uncharacterized protein LOC109337762 [Lupinus angustifolius]|uniref:uncharacterized protein LOC109337762 n=1 Tax=Lupinus angustifolius TaxID=3871 RepID=UPI00092EF3C9|nr:PREDICTED: uncharacterized protein LOC109337762 [Lupinus angustifolius]